MKVTHICAHIGSYTVDDIRQGVAAIRFRLPWENEPSPHATRFEKLTHLGFFTKLDERQDVCIETEYRILPGGMLEKCVGGQVTETINTQESLKRAAWETLTLMAVVFSVNTHSIPLGNRAIVSGSIEVHNYYAWIGFHGKPRENVPDLYWEGEHYKTIPTFFVESILLYGTPDFEYTDFVWDREGQSPLCSP